MQLLLLNIIVVFFCFSISGQDTLDYGKRKEYTIKTDILLTSIALVSKKNVLWFTLSGEKFLTNKRSFQFSVSYMDWKENDRYQIKSWQMIPQYKFFLFNKKPNNGFYIGSYFKYQYDYSQEFSLQYYYQNGELISTKKTIDLKMVNHYVSIGGMMGYQLFIRKRVAFELLVHVGIKKNIYSEIKETNNNYTPSKFKYGMDNLLLFNIGYCFGKN